jgi:hypothetical protein
MHVHELCELFHSMTEYEIHAATMAMREDPSHSDMASGYILAIERARTILRTIIKDEK